MTKNQLRPIVVDGEVYLWKLNHYYDIWEGTLVVYSSQHKKGRLEVHYLEADYFEWNKFNFAVVDEQDNRTLNIHEPEPTAQVIRYAREHLGWNPDEQASPLIIEHGFDILKQVGYVAKLINEPLENKPLTLDDLKEKINAIEGDLADETFVVLATFERDERKLHVALTERLRSRCIKGKVWKSKPFLTALKNAEYGFDRSVTRSSGGRDGIFLLDRDFTPANAMMHKIFDQFLDKSDGGINEIAAKIPASIDDLQAARLVSHHMRLLGVLYQGEDEDWLILVDFDQTK